MKRSYTAPLTEVLRMDLEQPLAMSLNNQKGSGNQLSRESIEIDAEDLFLISVLM